MKPERTRLQSLIGLLLSLVAAYIFFLDQKYILFLPIVLIALSVWGWWYMRPQLFEYEEQRSQDAGYLRFKKTAQRQRLWALAILLFGFVLIGMLFVPLVHRQAWSTSVGGVGLLFVLVGALLMFYRTLVWWRDYLTHILKR